VLNCGNQNAAGQFRLYCGELPYREGSVDPRSNGLTVASDIYRASAIFHFTDELSLNYTYGSVGSKVSSLYSSDTDPLVGQTLVFPRQNVFYRLPQGNTISHTSEARLRYSKGSLNMLLGGYRQRQHDVDSFMLVAYPLSNAPLDTLTPSLTLNLTNRAEARTALDAVFGQVTYRMLDDRLGVDLQARYSWEDKSLRPSPLTTNLFFKQPFKYFTPRVAVDYRFSPENMIYASVAKGVKSGGFNTTVYVASQRAYDPDRNFTYEIGTKNDFFDHRLRINAAAFYIDWQNIQTGAAVLGVPAGVIAPSLIGNGKGAKVPGFEVETQFVVGGGLSLDGSISYQNARFKKGSISQRTVDLGLCVRSTVCPANGDVGNNQLPRSSKFQAQAGFNFNRPINDDLSFFARGDATYQTKQYVEDLNLSYVPSRTVANASLGVTFDDDHYELQLWAKNLFDEKYLSAVSAVVAATDSSYAPNPGPRRTVGATIRARY
jgi:iron complex outermembrane receptor protein